MNMVDIITRKRDGGTLSREEIDYFIEGYTAGEIPDYQASALLMAIYFRHLDRRETYLLTDAMMRSGDIIDLSGIDGVKVDKHSTGGVGDKTTLIAAPLAAALGVRVAKMSGRGLGFTGGTVDKMESIPGFETSLEEERFTELVNKNGIAVTGQTAHIARADKKLYALRDVTATVDDISLITSSVMSKKLASGSDAIVLDVKCGSGAFMKDLDQARKMAELMVEMGDRAGKKTIALISDMDQPLGRAVGNSLEVIEAIETLKGKGPRDISDLSLALAGAMAFAGGAAQSMEEGRAAAAQALQSGAGLEKFRAFVAGQGGNAAICDDYTLFGEAKFSREVCSPASGYISRLNAERIGLASQHTGAGREKKDDVPDLRAGIRLKKKRGARVDRGETLAVLYANSEERLETACKEYLDAVEISDERPRPGKLILDIVS
ncbi:MAG: thymidine phosphorylase [Anaerovoracaceae bacterium]|jgi:pyrimidine-nucleoside phosphorylase